MTRHNLALTLIKVFGFIICVTSVLALLGTFLSLCYAAYLSKAPIDMARYFLSALPTSQLLFFAAGFICILRAEAIVTKIFGFPPGEK